MAIELQAKQAPMTQVELSNLKCVFPDHTIMVVTSSHSLLAIQKSCAQDELQPNIPHPTVCIQSRVTHKSWELMQLHLTGPQQELPLLPQFPCTQGFHITELMLKGCPFHCLALPASTTFR